MPMVLFGTEYGRQAIDFARWCATAPSSPLGILKPV
jgi:hypothetical protein